MTDRESTFSLSSGPDRTAHRVIPVLPGEHLLLALLRVLFRFPALHDDDPSLGSLVFRGQPPLRLPFLSEDGRALVLVVGTARRVTGDSRGAFAHQGPLGVHLRFRSHRQPARHDLCLSFGVGQFPLVSKPP